MSGDRRLRFEADGFVVRPTYLWLLGPVLTSAVGIALLVDGNLLGTIVQAAAMILLAAGIQRRPRKRRHARITVDDYSLHADGEQLVGLAEIVGLSVTSRTDARHLVVATRDGTTVDIQLPSDLHVAELRAAIGLALSRSASESFEAHAAFGCLSAGATLLASIYLIVQIAATFDYRQPLAMGVLVPLVIAGVPLLLARLRMVTIRCGAEGIYVERSIARSLWGRRMIPWRELTQARAANRTTVEIWSKQKRLDYELGSAEDLARLLENIKERVHAPIAEGDVNLGALLARGQQAPDAWLAAVRKQAAPGNESYRSVTLPEDRLWTIVEDPGADPTARVGAAVALRAQLRVADIEKRIRIAAGTTALPEVREAFAEIADEPDDERAIAKVARIVR